MNGIPQLNFFDEEGEFRGYSLGVRKINELNGIFIALINNLELPYLTKFSNSSDLNLENFSNKRDVNNILRSEGPRAHS